MTDVTFPCMGTHARLLVADAAVAAAGREFLEHVEAALTRFTPESELSRLNAAPDVDVPASPLLRAAVAAARWAAELTGGLVDPTLLSAVEAAGYDRDRPAAELPLAEALAAAPPRRPARPHPAASWRDICVTDEAVLRPAGVRLDLGGTAKGLAADLLARRLTRTRVLAGPGVLARPSALAGPRPYAGPSALAGLGAPAGPSVLAGLGAPAGPRALTNLGAPAGPRVLAGPRLSFAAPRWAVDCGGDLRVHAPDGEPFEVDVRHPLTGEPAHRFRLTDGAVATSGLDVRLWRAPDGAPRHHLIDPATQQPAWTGLIGATALAPTALEAEARAKAALLSGDRAWLAAHGGVLVRDDGDVEVVRPGQRQARHHACGFGHREAEVVL